MTNQLLAELEMANKKIEEKDKEIKRLNKEKDDLDDCNRHLYNENKRLNNIIDELEKWLNNNENTLIHYDYESKYEYIYVDELLKKLKELKEGSDKECI